MKKTSRILAILLAALLLVGVMATGAMAAAAITEEGSVKITNAVAGSDYKFYRVLDIDGISVDGKSTFITNTNWNEAIRTFGMGYATFNGEEVGASVTVDASFNSPEVAQGFAVKAVAKAGENSIAPDKTEAVDTSGEKTISGLQYGFYVMVSTRATSSTNPKYSVFTINSDTEVEVTEKNEELPSISKKVNNSDGISADFNAVLNYTVTIKAAAGTDTYVISDQLPAEITYEGGSLNLTKKDGTNLELNTDYTVTADTSGMGSITLTDTFRASLADYDEIVISYQGKLKANINTLQAYTNTAKLDFGPAEERDSRSDSAHVYSGHISFYKKDNSGNDLAGAKFVVKNKDGKYAKLTESGAPYSFVEWVDDEATATVITTTGAATEIMVRGLAAGTYTLVETAAPDGYIKGADTEVLINKTVDETTMSVTALSTATATVINTKGSELPDTGGIGTTIFYIAGGLLVLCALALVVVKRRKAE